VGTIRMKPSIMILMLWVITAFECSAETSRAERITADIQKRLPDGWTCTLISEKGKMGHPHGLGEPLFRLDFINTNLTFNAAEKKGQNKPAHPNLRLHFHDIAEREHVLQTIEAEEIFSHDIPVLFIETKEYVVVTSPLWVNFVEMEIGAAGVHTEEASEELAPLVKALRKYFETTK